MDIIVQSIPEALQNVATMLLDMCENWRKGDTTDSQQSEDETKRRKVRCSITNLHVVTGYRYTCVKSHQQQGENRLMFCSALMFCTAVIFHVFDFICFIGVLCYQHY